MISLNQHPRRVLIVSAVFPPAGGAGVQRPAKFAKYLPQNGWFPTVWATDDYAGLPHDPGLLADLPPEVTVERFPNAGFTDSLHRWLGERTRIGAAVEWRAKRLWTGWALPDVCVNWARRSVRPLVELIERERVEALYSTFSPASNHLLALLLKRRTGLPWIADFRDLWVDDYRYRETSPRRRREHHRLQQQVLEQADVVTAVTHCQTEVLTSHVPYASGKFVTITNGFDPEDFEGVHGERVDQRQRFVLAHAGRLDRFVFHDALLSGLSRFVYNLGPKKSRFQLRLIGRVASDVHARLERAGIDFEHTGYLPHRQAVREMASADALLVSVPDGTNGHTTIPGKVFECLASGRPLLAVGPDSYECGELVRRCRGGFAVGLSAQEIYLALGELFRAWSAGRPMPGADPANLIEFSRVTTTAQLAQVLDQLVASPAVGEAAAAQVLV